MQKDWLLEAFMCLGISLVTLVNPVWLSEEVWGFPEVLAHSLKEALVTAWNGPVRGPMDQIMSCTWMSHSIMVTEQLQEMK